MLLTNWICSQIGAREHYAVPRALQQGGQLDELFTDFWAGSTVRLAARILPSSRLKSLSGRWHQGLGNADVTSWNLQALRWEAAAKWKSGKRIENQKSEGQVSTPHPTLSPLEAEREIGKYSGYIEVGKKFACAVRDRLRQSNSIISDTIFFGYDTGSLETLEYLKERGVRCVLDQMDPNRVEIGLVQEEEKRWSGWAIGDTVVPEAYFKRREQEWALADFVVVNSEFSRQALIQQGVPREKLVVVPLCYETEAGGHELEVRSQESGVRGQRSEARPLKVLFLGQVILRKGIQYLIEAAKLLVAEPVHFDVVGPIGISEAAVKSAPRNMTFHGRVNRDQAKAWYQQADVFVLPTLSDGFALTQLEAIAHGLPVIVTPNCGEVVTDGADGVIVPARDANGLAHAIQCYLKEPALLLAHGTGAKKKIAQFTLAGLASKLMALEAGMT